MSFMNRGWDAVQVFEGPGFAADNTHLHLDLDGRWGTWDATGTSIGELALIAPGLVCR